MLEELLCRYAWCHLAVFFRIMIGLSQMTFNNEDSDFATYAECEGLYTANSDLGGGKPLNTGHIRRATGLEFNIPKTSLCAKHKGVESFVNS
jgi:hypothetical protein